MTASPLRSGDPRQLGPYRILGRLGEGGMGSVFLAAAPGGTRVAIKVIRPELASDPGFRARFRSEVKRVRQVPPFCTAEVLDADADHDPPYLVVEYIAGASLAEIVREHGPLSGSNLHSVAIGISTALAAIHDAGVIHRDLKPANVLFAPIGTPRVIDFGIAKALDTTNHHTVPGQIVGTIAYMGPERFNARTAGEVGTAADIFAWGAVVVFAATAHTPFAPDTLIATAEGMPLPAPDLSGLPGSLRELVAQALAADPRRRPSAHDLLEQLLRVGDPQSLADRPELKRAAAAALRNTVRIDPAILAPTRPGWTRWLGRRTLAGVAAGALVAGFAAYPVTRNLIGSGIGAHLAPAPPSLDDRDDAAGDKASRATRNGHCTLDGPLEVTPDKPKPFTCPASRRASEQSIRTQVKLAAPDACAAIWTHITEHAAYRITACADHVALDLESEGRSRPIAYAALDAPADPAAWHQLEIVTPGQGMTVSFDREQAISKARLAPQPSRGTVVLGIQGRGMVTFTDVTVTSTP